jgi:hypothetical protein
VPEDVGYGDGSPTIMGTIGSAVWASAQYEYLYRPSVWKGLSQGRGFTPPGFFGFRTAGGRVADFVQGEATKGSFRHGAGRAIRSFIVGGQGPLPWTISGTQIPELGASPDPMLKYTAAQDAAKNPFTTTKGKWLRRAGLGMRALTAVNVGVFVGSIGMGLAYSAGQGIVGAAQGAGIMRRNAMGMELGGQLASGHMTQMAATERQRAVQIIAETRSRARPMGANLARNMHR